jgi:Multiubiquitin
MVNEKKKYKFFVDDKSFEVDTKSMSGSQIKSLAGVDPAFQLFLEEHGADKPDRLITNDHSVDLGQPGVEKFYTVPPATFGLQ